MMCQHSDRAYHGCMAEVRWLGERESRAWRSFLGMRRAIDRGLDRQLMQHSGLSAADYQLLVPLSEAPEHRLRARDLGRLVDWERSRLSHQIRRMEQRGLIARSECPTDARGTIIVLSDLGQKTLEAAAPSHVQWVRDHFIDLLTEDELEGLTALSERVLERIAADGEPVAATCCDEADADEEEAPACEELELDVLGDLDEPDEDLAGASPTS